MQKLPDISFEKSTRSSKNLSLVAFQSNPDHVPTEAELDITNSNQIQKTSFQQTAIGNDTQ